MQTNRYHKGLFAFMTAALLLAAPAAQAQFFWEVGMDDNGWPAGDGGGPFTTFVQEAGVNPLPGDPFSPEINQQADDDYYFEGIYTVVIPSNGEYEPVGVVSPNEEAAERAFAGSDNTLRYHFNLPSALSTNDAFTITFDALNLDTRPADPRYGIEVYVNGILVQPEIVIRPAQLGRAYTTPHFRLGAVNAGIGPEYDNIVMLKGISYSGSAGGEWMGIDYVRFDQQPQFVPAPTFPVQVGMDDNGWPVGNGGGTNATFVQENGAVNALPGSPTSPETNRQADNDYYFAGIYTNVIAGNGEYEPVGIVPVNEEAAERAFAGSDNELRYHFNLPNNLAPTDMLQISFDAFNLHTDGVANPRWGVEIYFNGVRVQPEVLIRPADLDRDIITPQFSLASVNGRVGAGHDNIITLKGISYSSAGGGDWMGIDYVKLAKVEVPIPTPVLPWAVGQNDNGHPAGNGGGPNATFVQEDGAANPLPGNPNSPEVNRQADDDYYFAGVYTTVLPGNGDYTPVGTVRQHEEAAERAFAGVDNTLRYHFNLPPTMSLNDQVAVSFDAVSLQSDQANPRYGVEVYFNGVKVLNEVVIGMEQLGLTYSTAPFTLASVNAQVGFGFDNIVTLKGINYNADGGGNWMGIDYVQLNPILPAPFPWSVGRDDNSQPRGNGGGPNTSFVQENGSINPLPGNPSNAEVDRQSDNDYYFAGEYTKIVPSVVAEYGEYQPIGLVLVNEESAERAFAGADNDLRYHFNLPASLQPTDQLLVTFDAVSLHTGQEDSRYGIEVWVNGIKVMDEIVIRPEQLDVDYTAGPFTLASVNAITGPGGDNIVSLKGINYNAEGGGNWMGIDYVNLDPMPKPVWPVLIGKDDNGWPAGDGGGPNATFVQENGVVNDLPGRATNVEVNQQADNDYYLAGVYTNVIASNGDYTPLGIVPRNEEAAERAFVPANDVLRYHFNLPATLRPTDRIAVTFDALNLQATNDVVTNPKYGVEVYFNGVLVQPEILVTPQKLDQDFTTPAFTLASVNAQTGLGTDNIVTLKGIDYSAEGGGNWMGIDYVRVHSEGDTGAIAQFGTPTIANGRITLTWTGSGTLEWTTDLASGNWTPVAPAPASPYTEDLTATRRFYRLRR